MIGLIAERITEGERYTDNQLHHTAVLVGGGLLIWGFYEVFWYWVFGWWMHKLSLLNEVGDGKTWDW